MSGWKLPLALVVAYGFACLSAPSAAADPPPGVDVRSEDGKVVIAADQVRSYEWATHTLTLAPGVREELAKQLRNNRIVSGIPFAVTVGGKALYKGKFTSVVSSRSFSTPVIVVDARAVEPKLGEDRLRIQLGYPTAEFFRGEDPRADPRLREALEAGGKLSRAGAGHTEWVAGALREMQAIKPGMTREDLLKVFREEGGVSSRTAQRYVYRECPYIKVDVTFEAVGAQDDKLTKSPKDRIAGISRPFLEWSIED
jgi:hypothetical protein